MDLNRALADHQVGLKMKELDEKDLKIILVCPAATDLPDDGFLHYSAGADIKAILATPDGAVLVFGEHQSRLLKMLVEFQDEFGSRVKVLEGVPDAPYNPWFNSIVWSQDKVSYSGLLSEISIAEAQKREDADDPSAYEKEAKQYTRANGTVKDQDNFHIAGEDEDGGDQF